ncbi:unnamed protein product [Mytilus edulis]|uniref:Reverse transcriptase domain-containing protein n=1 Tax=Mytilus edulis TaxID=6550 RepID=A0A8S3UYZ7_MYTED|nr:unnamed protein product [Mytilus edulis]
MYTNMEFNELIHSVGRAYSSAVKEDYPIKLPSCETIKSLVATVLKNNYFEFNDRYFVQKIGASMGSKCSPEICDIRAFEVLNEVIEKFKYKNKILFYGRYRDDAFIIAHSSREESKCANGKVDLQKIIPDHSLLTWEITLKFSQSNKNAAQPKNNRKTKTKYDIKNIPEDWLSSESALNDIDIIIQNLEFSNVTQDKINNMYDAFVNVIKTEMSTKLSSKVIVLSDGVNN